MNQFDRDVQRVRALEDQTLASLRDRLPDIERIGHYGPRPDGSDSAIVQVLSCFVAGMIHRSDAESA